MATQEELTRALSNLPDDVKAKIKSATPEQKIAFVKSIESQIHSSEASQSPKSLQDRLNESGSESATQYLGVPAIGEALSRTVTGVDGDAFGKEIKATTAETVNNALGYITGLTGGANKTFNLASGMVGSGAGEITNSIDDIFNKLTGEHIPSGSARGQAVGFFAGAGGRGASSVGKLAEEAVLGKAPKITASKALATGFTKSAISNAVKRGALNGATSGAVSGATVPMEENNPVDRLTSVIAGSVIGGTVGSLTGLATGFKQLKLSASAKKVRENLDRIHSRGVGKNIMEGDRFSVAGNPTVTKKTPGLKSVYDRNAFPKKEEDLARREIQDRFRGKISSVRAEKEVKIAELSKIRDAKIAENANNNLKDLQSSTVEIKKQIADGTNQAIENIKGLGRPWINAQYKWYGGEIERAVKAMGPKGISARALSDSLDEVLTNEGLIGSEISKRLPTNSTERALLKWAEQLRNGLEKSGDDAVIEGGDLLARLKDIRGTENQRLVNKAINSIGGKVSGLSGEPSAIMSKANAEYSKFAPIRDFLEDVIVVDGPDVDKATKAIRGAIEKNPLDASYSQDTLRKLKIVEQKLGIPFLDELKKRGGSIEKLESDVAKMKDMLAKTDDVITSEFQTASKAVASDTASRLRDISLERADALKALTQKSARTNAVINAIEARLKRNFDVVFSALNFVDRTRHELTTAAMAYLLARSLGKVVSRED